jgi:CIC family chloride channel protein
MLLHAALVGVAAGLFGAGFLLALEVVQRFMLENLAGYVVLRASGEALRSSLEPPHFRPWLLLFIPALGGLACGLLTTLAPEARGGGGDATIDAFHHQDGIIRRRVIWVKTLASLFTLGFGGAGGREGPTMQIGGALGSFVARVLKVSARERRILLIAGVGAGISAVFRTPLGAALLAVEVLYRDGYESDALIPSVLASVISYSVVISISGESTLFSHAGRFPFIPAQLPLYGLLALLVAALAAVFVSVLQRMNKMFASLPVPQWVRPAVGGLLLGALATPLILLIGLKVGTEGQGLGILGGGYGAVQMAITGANWLPGGWRGVQLLLLLTATKLLAASLTIGSGGSAGDFAPSLAIGGLFGGAFGRALQLLLHNPAIDPGAFALVGMGVFYGGIAHVPLAALVLVCELAGNYDLLVPLMLAQGLAFVALRKRALYKSQVLTQRDSPVHREALFIDVLKGVQVKDLMARGRPCLTFTPQTSAAEVRSQASGAARQEVFPVMEEGKLVGLVSADAMRALTSEQGGPWTHVADIMQPPVSVRPEDDLRTATEQLLANGLREVPVVDEHDAVVGFLDEREIARVYLRAEPPSEEAIVGNAEAG